MNSQVSINELNYTLLPPMTNNTRFHSEYTYSPYFLTHSYNDIKSLLTNHVVKCHVSQEICETWKKRKKEKRGWDPKLKVDT